MLFSKCSGRRAVACAAALLVALVLGACGSSGGSSSGTPPSTGPIAFANLPQRAGTLLGGGRDAFAAELAALKGHPVVVNQWASWCGPCRFEFPFFDRVARRYRGQVAFLGLNSQDNDGDAVAFLRKNPAPYPHFADADTSIARKIGGGRAWPTTIFYDAAGKRTATHPGAYASPEKLAADVAKYALHG